jgi:hypothetical protein
MYITGRLADKIGCSLANSNWYTYPHQVRMSHTRI